MKATKTARRYHWDPRSSHSAAVAAQRMAEAAGRTMYVYATAYGHMVAVVPPPGAQHYMRVMATGSVLVV